MPNIVQTNQLTKIIDGKELVKNVNIHVKKGEVYGFLGPNGAGKTTVMKMLTNLWKPTSGEVWLFGEKLTPTSYEVLKRMGSIIEFPCFYDHMSGKDNLQLHSEYMGYHTSGCVEDALEMLGLADASEKQVKSYSLGMKQRLGIARAILCKPELLILDEPTNGLDPAGMKQIRDLFRMLCSEYGITIIISSHMLSEVESIADTIGVINHGSEMCKIMEDMKIESLKEVACHEMWNVQGRISIGIATPDYLPPWQGRGIRKMITLLLTVSPVMHRIRRIYGGKQEVLFFETEGRLFRATGNLYGTTFTVSKRIITRPGRQ